MRPRPVLVVLLAGALAAGAADETPAAFLAAHCGDCHDAGSAKGGFDLATLAGDPRQGADLERWAKVIDQVRAGKMPPAKKPRPAADRLAGFLTAADAALDAGIAVARGRANRAVARRLTRDEYRASIRDLTAHPFDPTGDFVDDAVSHGFDRVGAGQHLSALDLQILLAAAERIAAKVIDVPATAPVRQHWRLVNQRQSGAVVDDKGKWHNGLEGKKREQIKAGRFAAGEPMRNLEIPNGIFAYGMVDLSGPQPVEHAAFSDIRPYLATHPKGRTQRLGFRWFAAEEGLYRFRIRVRGSRPDGWTGLPPTLTIETFPEKQVLCEHLIAEAEREITVELWRDDLAHYQRAGNRSWGLDLSMPVPRPLRVLRDPLGLKGVDEAASAAANAAGEGATPSWGLHVVSIDFEGPLHAAWPPPWQRRFFEGIAPGADEAAYAAALLGRFAERAVRRPPPPADLARVLAAWRQARADGAGMAEALKAGIVRTLVSPRFLYLLEPAADGPARRLDDWEIASRLSYFLTSAPPDDALRAAAAAGRLGDADERERQARRLLADPRIAAFSRSFARQWLDLRRLHALDADQQLYPAWDHALKRSMAAETEAFVHEVLVGGHDVAAFIDSDFAMLDARLARLYGVPGVDGDGLRRVALTPEHGRGGLLAQASVLTLTSNGVRTQPITRGAWILERLLDDPPPPPPPGAGELEDTAPPKPDATIRERLELHRSDAACAACHRSIDPLGFALEGFDAIGRRRTHEQALVAGALVARAPVDTAGEMPDGRPIAGFAGLKQVLLAERARFLDCLTRRLITYALGRPAGVADRPLLAELRARAGQGGATLPTLITGLVRSQEFVSR